MTSELLSVAEVAERMRKGQRFVLDELRRKNLRGSKFGHTWRVSEEDLQTYIDSHANVSRVRRSA